MSAIEFEDFDVLSFDCYGTLIDWERGIIAALAPVLAAHGVEAADEDLLEAFGSAESELEAGPYLRYRELLGEVLGRIGERLGFVPTSQQRQAFGASVAQWPAFDDSAQALARLKRRFKLAVITNCDDDLFAASNERLGVRFDWIVTAQQAGSYKPSERNFELAFATIDAPRHRILHVAQSLFHDHVTAKRLGMTTVWIDRRQGRGGAGATPPAQVTPDLVAPDMATLAALAVPDRDTD
jgi:2-haloacid dehalogenase